MRRPTKRVFLGLVALAILGVAVYWFALRGSSTTTAEAKPIRPVAQIGNGKKVLVVGNDGRLIGAYSGKKASLPVLPLKKRPPGDHVRGHVLEEVRILAATPKPLRRYVEATKFGKTGITVELISGIEIRFGDQHEASRKWKAAATVLADPSATLLSYVDVHSPTRPSKGGEGHELPPAA